MMQPGRARSIVDKRPRVSPGTENTGADQVLCMLRVAAPAASAATIESPVLPVWPPLRTGLGCSGTYFARSVADCSKPPAASTTPLRAPMRSVRPLWRIMAPVTRPFSWTSSVSGLSSHSSTPRCLSASRKPPASALPSVR